MKILKEQVRKVCEKLGQDFISFDFLGRGCHNENYAINTKQDRFVLRVENNFIFKNLKNEYRFLKKSDGKFGPKVFLFDSSKKIIPNDFLVEEFVEGEHPKKFGGEFVKEMALWYKRLHENKDSGNVKPLEKRDEIKRYNKFKHVLDPEIKEELDRICSKCIVIFRKSKSLFREVNLSLNHGDPSGENIFILDEKIRLIDWEFVKYDYIEADLVFFMWSYDLNKKMRNLFLDTYGYKKNSRRLDVFMLSHILGMISWKMQRLDLVYKNKIDANQYCSTREQIYEEIGEDVKKINKVLEFIDGD